MQLDRILTGILREIQGELKEKFGVEYDISDIKDIVVSQFRSAAKGFEKLEVIKLDYWGKFLIKPGRKEAIKLSKELKGKSIEERKDKLNGTVYKLLTEESDKG
jgi:hypothetical protein